MKAEVHDLTAGYALDALEPAERDAYEAHLDGCARCRDELASFSEVTVALALAVAGPAPPAALRERVLAAARAEPQTVVPLAGRRRRPPLVWLVAAAAAAAAAAAIGLGLHAASLSSDLDETRAALARQERAAAVLADPSARTVSLTGAEGRLVVGGNGDAVLVLRGLAPAPEGMTFVVWVIESGTPARAGLFPAAETVTAVPVERPVGSGAVVAVTLERAGGVDAPTSDPIVTSRPV